MTISFAIPAIHQTIARPNRDLIDLSGNQRDFPDPIYLPVLVLKVNGVEHYANRVEELWGYREELSEKGEGVFIDTAFAFTSFIIEFNSRVSISEKALISFLSNGSVATEWRLNDNKHFTIEFIDKTTAKYTLIVPVNKSIKDDNVYSNQGSHDLVISELQSYGVGD